MTGLEKIINKINEESEAKIAQILNDAETEASKIVFDAKSEALKTADEIVNNAKSQAEKIVQTAKSSAEAYEKQSYLKIKNAIINDIISAAYEKILLLNDSEYFDFLLKIVKKHIEPGECTMRLNKKDLNRLPEGFCDKINGEVYKTSAVEISNEPLDIENGFVLDYGNYEINCTVKSVFDEKMDFLKDTLCASLFEV